VVTGGVAANARLRREVEAAAAARGWEACFPSPVFCTDNAAMIACAGYHLYRRGDGRGRADFHDLDARANLPLDVSSA
jgi:N6-L-threonylcarbamoyladenine synthase